MSTICRFRIRCHHPQTSKGTKNADGGAGHQNLSVHCSISGKMVMDTPRHPSGGAKQRAVSIIYRDCAKERRED